MNRITEEAVRKEIVKEEKTTKIVTVLAIITAAALILGPVILCATGTISIFGMLFYYLLMAFLGNSMVSLLVLRLQYMGIPWLTEYIGLTNTITSTAVLSASGSLMMCSAYCNAGRWSSAKWHSIFALRLGKYSWSYPKHVNPAVKTAVAHGQFNVGEYELAMQTCLDAIAESRSNYEMKPTIQHENTIRIAQGGLIPYLKDMGAEKEAHTLFKRLAKDDVFCREATASDKAYVYWAMSYAANAVGHFEKARQWAISALSHHKQANGSKGLKSEIIANVAHAQLGLANYDEALKWARQCYELRKGFGYDTSTDMAECYYLLGRANLGLGKTEEARTQLEDSVAIRKARLDKKCPSIAYALEAYAECLTAIGDAEYAKQVSEEAHSIRQYHGTTDDTRIEFEQELFTEDEKQESVRDLVTAAIARQTFVSAALASGLLFLIETTSLQSMKFSLLDLFLLCMAGYFGGRAIFMFFRKNALTSILENLDSMASENASLRLFKKGKLAPQFSGIVLSGSMKKGNLLYFDIPRDYSPPEFNGEPQDVKVFRKPGADRPSFIMVDKAIHLISDNILLKGSPGLRTVSIWGLLGATTITFFTGGYLKSG